MQEAQANKMKMELKKQLEETEGLLMSERNLSKVRYRPLLYTNAVFASVHACACLCYMLSLSGLDEKYEIMQRSRASTGAIRARGA